MPEPESFLRPALEKYLRRRYATNLAGLKALADKYWADTSEDTVTITGQSFEGGQANGMITCPRGLLLDVVEDLIAELDPDNAPRLRPTSSVARFSSSWPLQY